MQIEKAGIGYLEGLSPDVDGVMVILGVECFVHVDTDKDEQDIHLQRNRVYSSTH